jgi:hypothetical protein
MLMQENKLGIGSMLLPVAQVIKNKMNNLILKYHHIICSLKNFRFLLWFQHFSPSEKCASYQ